ncbi:DUF4256 family protein [Acinetobacter sp. ANC 4216]|nr:DUF4256 family protein [Acinetobacter sp. ANC 4216]
MRKENETLFGDKHYGQVFIYHNGAESYYIDSFSDFIKSLKNKSI